MKSINKDSIEPLSLTGVKLTEFPLKDINQLTSRQAMALPETYKSSFLDSTEEIFKTMIGWSADQKVETLESTEQPFINRWVAGQLLALEGDPRINVYDPSMVTVEGGEATLGLEQDRAAQITEKYSQFGVLLDWILKETPTYTRQIATFRMAKYCVTNKEYLAFMKDSGYKEHPNSWVFGSYPIDKSNHPVYTLPESAGDAYAAWLSVKTGRKFRLPTEAEWEYTACGKTRTCFPWGNEFEADHANTIESGILRTTPVGMFPKGLSPFGCHDMAGNVEEYVQDDYTAYPGAEIIADDLILKHGQYRMARGGSFTRFSDLARCKRRHGNFGAELYIMGFRLAEDIE